MTLVVFPTLHPCNSDAYHTQCVEYLGHMHSICKTSDRTLSLGRNWIYGHCLLLLPHCHSVCSMHNNNNELIGHKFWSLWISWPLDEFSVVSYKQNTKTYKMKFCSQNDPSLIIIARTGLNQQAKAYMPGPLKPQKHLTRLSKDECSTGSFEIVDHWVQ